MSDEILFDGVRYISASDAGHLAGFTRDYVARLCKEGKLPARRIGKQWYTSKEAFRFFLTSQAFAREKRRGDLSRERREEYRSGAPANTPTRAPLFAGRNDEIRPPRVAERMQTYAHRALASAVRTPTAISAARAVSSAPLHAVSLGKHVSAHALPPIGDALHKLLAIVTALLFTVGTYLFVDAEYARLTHQSGVAERASLLASAIVDSGKQQLALASENPAGTFSDMIGEVARALNRRVDSLVYGIMYPPSLIGFTNGRDVVSVRVRVKPLPTPASSLAKAAHPTPSSSPFRPAETTIVNQPTRAEPVERVIERVVETQRIVAAAGGLTEEILTERLNALDGK
ncbi:helix-turn-helix domain-containing protein, partial [Candidatus Kaiserbacteria bacterium]|nr:helix-turn-helix domain-containing protein [Candidatus Kaiserbacteria bacterium]